jgi:hypothetical protein
MKRSVRKTHRRTKNMEGTELGITDLMLALLASSLETYKDGLASPVPAKRVEAFRVEAWAVSDEDHWPFAFVNVCRHVGVSPEYVRDRMAEWRRQTVQDEAVH